MTLASPPDEGPPLIDPPVAAREADLDEPILVAAYLDQDPAWVLVRDGPAMAERAHETLFTVADGFTGTRGSRECGLTGATPAVLVIGVYTGGKVPVLLSGPHWCGLDVAVAEGIDAAEGVDPQRVLDLRTGVLTGILPVRGGRLRTVRFSCVARPGVVALRADGPAGALSAGPALRAPLPQADVTVEADDDPVHARMSVTAGDGGGVIGAMATQRTWADDDDSTVRVIERMAAYTAEPDARGATPHGAAAVQAKAALERAWSLGFDALLDEQRAAWSARWADADISIDGDPVVQFGARFALFHLLSSVGTEGEAAVGARGLSGGGYGGHVFWDADVFVLPTMAAVNPPAARAMLEYRIRRLGAARANAAARGRSGARFPWESAADGHDVTPREAIDPNGNLVQILTGDQEEHIVADVAWAAQCYVDWTGDDSFWRSGSPLITETARYWTSRARVDPDGRAHIDGVIGPDEYHEAVDDNAFTNVMARWNLERAADLVKRGFGEAGPAEGASWRALAAALVDGLDPRTGIYEQFAGFDDLEPLLIAEVAEPPIAADLLLGSERVQRSQVIKQADVLMLYHLVPDAVAPGSLAANLDHYLPRTAHGSSLSPAIHASLLARAGRPDEARELLELSCRMDLDDLTGMTAGGLHLATMGGVWQALVFGFAGVGVTGDGALRVDPCLPAAWDRLGVTLRHRGGRVRFDLRADEIRVTAERPSRLQVGKGAEAASPPAGIDPGETVFVRRADEWKRVRP